MQVQPLDRLLRRGREAKRASDTVKKQILLALLAASGVKETRIQSLGVTHAARLDQAELVRIRRPKNRQAIDAQGLGQLHSYLLEETIHMQLGTQFARELQQGAAIVITLAVKEPVQPHLYPIHHGLEKQSSDDDCQDPPTTAGYRDRGPEVIRK